MGLTALLASVTREQRMVFSALKLAANRLAATVLAADAASIQARCRHAHSRRQARRHRTTAPMRDHMLDFDQLNDVIGTAALLEEGTRYG